MDNDVVSNLGIKLANEAILAARLQAQVNQLTQENQQLKEAQTNGKDSLPDSDASQA